MFPFSKRKTTMNPPKPGLKTWSFRLGDEVKDKINGLTGIAMMRNYHLTGCDTFAVELPPHEGKPGETMNVCAERLELVTAHPDRHIDEIPDDDVNLGDVVKDLSTGMVGTVTVIALPLFGTTRACIEPGYHFKDLRMAEPFLVDTNIIEVVKPLNPAPKTVAEPAPAPVVEPIKEEAPAPKPKKRDGPCRMPRNY